MFSMALLPLVLDLQDAVPMVAVQCLVINVVLWYRHREDFRLQRILPLVAGALVGVPLGVLALSWLPAQGLFAVLGIVMLLYAAQNLRPSVRQGPPLSDRWGPLFGLVSGALGAAFNTGGPPAILYVAWKRLDKGATKATLLGFFCCISFVQVPLLAHQGLLQMEHVRTDLALVPAILLGAGAGLLVYQRLNAARFAKVLVVLIGLAGAQYLLRSFL